MWNSRKLGHLFLVKPAIIEILSSWLKPILVTGRPQKEGVKKCGLYLWSEIDMSELDISQTNFRIIEHNMAIPLTDCAKSNNS